jgi:HSP20 family protein
MASLVKWAPFGDLDLVDRRMRQMFDGFGVDRTMLPTSDVMETSKELIVRLDVPGFDEKQLSLEVADHTLAVRGERSEAPEETDAHVYVRERLDARFERLFVLPAEVDTSKIEASLKKGVLEVRVPKIEQATPRKIKIAA